jgi:hypothetical protein
MDAQEKSEFGVNRSGTYMWMYVQAKANSSSSRPEWQRIAAQATLAGKGLTWVISLCIG